MLAEAEVHRIQTGPVIDWCFQYSDAASIWVLTDNAWYKLIEPAAEFVPSYSPEAEKLAICGAAVLEMQEDPDTEILQAVDRAFASLPGSVKPDIKLRKFVESQLRAWIKVRLFVFGDMHPDLPRRRLDQGFALHGPCRLHGNLVTEILEASKLGPACMLVNNRQICDVACN